MLRQLQITALLDCSLIGIGASCATDATSPKLLLDFTHGRDGHALDRSIDVLISRLRRKLDTSGATGLFKTVRNGGYQLVVKVGFQEFPS